MNLTPREMEVWELIAEGMSGAEIAEKLGNDRKTTENITGALYRKIGLRNQGGHSRVRAAKLWWRQNPPWELINEIVARRTMMSIANSLIREGVRIEEGLLSQNLPCGGGSGCENSDDGSPDAASL